MSKHVQKCLKIPKTILQLVKIGVICNLIRVYDFTSLIRKYTFSQDYIFIWSEPNNKDEANFQEAFDNAYDVAKLPGILRSSGSDDGVSVVEAGKLLAPRWDIPLPLRKLLGEINKPELVTATSLSRISTCWNYLSFFVFIFTNILA